MRKVLRCNHLVFVVALMALAGLSSQAWAALTSTSITTSTSVTVAPGTTANYTVKVVRNSTATNATLALAFYTDSTRTTTTSAPTGVTSSFTPASPLTVAAGANGSTTTLALATNASTTPSGSYYFRVTATGSNSPFESFTADGVLVVNKPPTADAKSVTVIEDTPTAITLSGSDPDNDAITAYTIGTAPTKGSLSGTAPNLTYTPNANNTTSDSFTYTVTAGGQTSTAATVSITMTAVNDAPTVTGVSGTLSYTENQAATAIQSNSLTVADVDNANLASATVAITTNYQSGEDVLAFTNTANITGSFNSTTGVLTLTGSNTLANYQAALRAVRYRNTS
jgi:hypothetical protein